VVSDPEDALRREVVRLRAQVKRQQRARHHRMEVNKLAAQTSGEVSRRGVAEVIAMGSSGIFDSGWVMVAFVGEDEMIHFVHGPDVPSEIVEDWRTAPLEIDVPIAEVLRGETGRIELESRADFAPWPLMVAEADRANMSSFCVDAVPGRSRPHAVIALAWSEPHRLDSSERELLDELIDVATPAFGRATHTEADRDLVTTLQAWLLPRDLPNVPGLVIATMYEAGRSTLDVGGDWYDVVPLDDHRTAIVIGDVVGHDVRAIAEMAQVRHVLASHLIVTGDPAESLSLTDDYLHRRSADTMATALVMLINHESNTIELASAGHLSPVLTTVGNPSAAIECGLGPPIGSGLGGYWSQRRALAAEALIVAVTDGVIELRGETIDASMSAFCRALDEHAVTNPDLDVDSVIEMLRTRVDIADRVDDAAAVVFRTR
jgi:serine phosphatase RsbU (regulator of sigma subunit)